MSEGKLYEMQARVDLYRVIAAWMRELYTDEDEPVAAPEVIADRLRRDFPQMDQEAVNRMLSAARAVTRYIVDCILVDAKEVSIRTPHKAGHA